jgi:hypothetical protein
MTLISFGLGRPQPFRDTHSNCVIVQRGAASPPSRHALTLAEYWIARSSPGDDAENVGNPQAPTQRTGQPWHKPGHDEIYKKQPMLLLAF